MKNFISLLPLLFLTACSTPASLYLLDHRFQKPYTSGGWSHGALGLGAGGASQVEVVKDITANPPIDSGTDVNARGAGFSADIQANIGLLKYLDFVYENSGYGLSIQILGDQKSGWQSTVSTSYIYSPNFSKGEEDDTKYTIDLKGLNYGLSIGYKNSIMTPYFSIGKKDLEGKTTIDQAAQSFEYEDKGNQIIASLGLYLDFDRLFIQLEASASRTDWNRADEPYDNITTGIMIGGRW